MDPNAALADMRQAIDNVLATASGSQAAHELAEAADALDTWLTSGGFLPEAWVR